MRPNGLTAICIIAIVLAGFGFLALTGGLFWWFYGEQFVEDMYRMMGLPQQQLQQQLDLQKPMYDEIAQLQQRWLPVTIVQTILHATLVALLFVAAIRGLKLRRGAGRLLTVAMAFAILFEMARIYPTLMIQQASNEISMRHTERVMQTGGNPAQTRAMITSIKQFQELMIALTYLILGGWTIAKLSYFGTSLWYVNRKDVKLLFEPEDTRPPPAAPPGAN